MGTSNKKYPKLDTETSDNVTCWTTFTWQIPNVLNVTDLLEWILEQDFYKFNRFSKMARLYISFVHNPVITV